MPCRRLLLRSFAAPALLALLECLLLKLVMSKHPFGNGIGACQRTNVPMRRCGRTPSPYLAPGKLSREVGEVRRSRSNCTRNLSSEQHCSSPGYDGGRRHFRRAAQSGEVTPSNSFGFAKAECRSECRAQRRIPDPANVSGLDRTTQRLRPSRRSELTPDS